MKTNLFDMSATEIKRKQKLTPEEKSLIADFLAAARALPKSICLEISDWGDGQDGIIVSKRITDGSAVHVARLRKKSLVF